MFTSRPARSVPLAVLLCGMAVLAIPFHLRPDNFIVDDGYFYPQIARSIVHGYGSTFNAIMPTNGFHPLWMVICILAAAITSSSSGLVQLLSVVQDLLTLLCVVFLFFISRAENKRGALFGCIPLAFFAFVIGMWRLLEANLSLTLQLCVLLAVVPVIPTIQKRLGPWRDGVVGLLLGMTLLARLDLVFFAAVVLGYQMLDGESAEIGKRIRSTAAQIIVTTLVVSPYLLWNLRTFHHLLPISGAIKNTFPRLQPWHVSAFVLPVLASIVGSSLLLFKKTRTNFDLLCLVTATAASLHLAYTLSFGSLSSWYLTTGYLNVALCMILVADRVLRWMPKIPLEPVLGGMVFLVFLTLASLRIFSNLSYARLMIGQVSFHGTYVEPKAALATKLKESLPAGSRIYIFDCPGGVAYFSGMSLLPADGLITDYQYNADLERLGFARYAAEHHIDYFIAPYLKPGQVYDRLSLSGTRQGETQLMNVRVPLTDRSAGVMALDDKNLLFRFREINPILEIASPEIGIWRIQH